MKDIWKEKSQQISLEKVLYAIINQGINSKWLWYLWREP